MGTSASIVPSPLYSGEKVSDRPDEGAFEYRSEREKPLFPLNRLQSHSSLTHHARPQTIRGDRGHCRDLQLNAANFKGVFVRDLFLLRRF